MNKYLTSIIAGASVLLSGCTTFNRNIDYVPVEKNQVKTIYNLASSNSVSSINQPLVVSTSQNALDVGKRYAGIAQADLTFTVASPGKQEQFRINTGVPGWANQYANQISALENLIPDNSYDSVQVIGSSDASSRKERRDLLSSRDGLVAVVNLSRVVGHNAFAFDVKQRRLAAKDTTTINTYFDVDTFHAKKTKSGVGETVFGALETAGAGALAGWPGAAIAGGINVVEGFHAHYSAKNRLPSGSSFSGNVNYLGLSGDEARIHQLFSLAARNNAKDLILVPSTDGLGVILANNPTRVFSPQEGVASFTTTMDEGQLRLLAISALRVVPYAVGKIDNCDHRSSRVTGGDGGHQGGGKVTGGDSGGASGTP